MAQSTLQHLSQKKIWQKKKKRKKYFSNLLAFHLFHLPILTKTLFWWKIKKCFCKLCQVIFICRAAGYKPKNSVLNLWLLSSLPAIFDWSTHSQFQNSNPPAIQSHFITHFDSNFNFNLSLSLSLSHPIIAKSHRRTLFHDLIWFCYMICILNV